MEWADLVAQQVFNLAHVKFKLPVSSLHLQCRDLQWLLDTNMTLREEFWTRDTNLAVVSG